MFTRMCAPSSVCTQNLCCISTLSSVTRPLSNRTWAFECVPDWVAFLALALFVLETIRTGAMRVIHIPVKTEETQRLRMKFVLYCPVCAFNLKNKRANFCRKQHCQIFNAQFQGLTFSNNDDKSACPPQRRWTNKLTSDEFVSQSVMPYDHVTATQKQRFARVALPLPATAALARCSGIVSLKSDSLHSTCEKAEISQRKQWPSMFPLVVVSCHNTLEESVQVSQTRSSRLHFARLPRPTRTKTPCL